MKRKGRKYAEKMRREHAREESCKRARRREDKKRTLKRKQEAWASRAEFVQLLVPDYTLEQLRAEAVSNWEILHDKQADPDADEAFIARITVNFLRHKMTGYEAALRRRPPAGMSKTAADKWAKQTILAEIANKYPHLAEECRHQAAQL